MRHDEMSIEVFAEVSRVKDYCNFGHQHEVRIVTRKLLGPVLGTREHNNGYEKRQTALRKDAQGRIYHQHIQIDFFNNVSWRRDDDGMVFYPGRGPGPVRDVLGRTLTPRP